MNRDAVSAALTAFPELQHLVDLRDAGWIFLPTENDGELIEIHGIHTWPGGWADAIRVRYTTDATALRSDHDDGIVWHTDGTLTDVVHGLITLPTPDHKLAPRLVRGHTQILWKPA